MAADSGSLERQVRYNWAASLVAGAKVLDAGCGSGWGTALLAETASEAMGVDFSPPAIADARSKHGALATFEEGDLRELPFAAGEFDYVVCFETIAHLPTPGPAIDEMRRVLRSKGTLLVSSPNSAVYPAGNPLHSTEMHSEELGSLLSARFENVVVHRQQSYFTSLLGSERLLAEEDPAGKISVRVAKLSGGGPGGELYAVAAASDGELPPAPAWIALGENVNYDEQQELLRDWQKRAVEAEAKALALTRELRALSVDGRDRQAP